MVTVRQADGCVTQRPVLRVFQRVVQEAELRANAKLSPVCITQGALGSGLPRRDLKISRQHRMLLSSKVAQRMFDVPEVLIPAVKLTGVPGIYEDHSVDEVTYFHLLFDRHEVIFADGAPSESLYTGKEALKALAPEAREEILELFPELAEEGYVLAPALPIPCGGIRRIWLSVTPGTTRRFWKDIQIY